MISCEYDVKEIKRIDKNKKRFFFINVFYTNIKQLIFKKE